MRPCRSVVRCCIALMRATLPKRDSDGVSASPAGTGSYVLFTLEKLIFKWVKQMQLIVQDDLTESLYKLYRRTGPRRRTALARTARLLFF